MLTYRLTDIASLTPPRRLVLVGIVVWAAVAWGAGCGTDRPIYQWNEAILETAKLRDDGRLEQARQRYAALADAAPDAEHRRLALVELAEVEAELGQVDQALAHFEQVYAADVDDMYGAKALFKAAELVERRGDAARARQMRRAVMRRFPESVGAEFALEAVVDELVEADRATTVETLRAIHDEVAGTTIGDNVLLHLGITLEERFDDPQAAVAVYEEIVAAYPEATSVDEAMWRAAEYYQARQRWHKAIALLEALASRVEPSIAVGSYNSPWANDARFALGLIDLLFLDDYAGAIAHFERYLDDFPHSIYADDAAWHIVEAHRLSGQTAAYRAALEAFIDDYPESRHVETAEYRLRRGRTEARR